MVFRQIGGILWNSYQGLRRIRVPDGDHEALKRAWALKTLEQANVLVQVKGTPCPDRPALFVGNHLSYLDIPLLLASAPGLGFVAKQELSSWPIFGEGMARAGAIFVNRESIKSRGQALAHVRNALSKERRQVAIFPSGTTTLAEEKGWQSGAFRLAHEARVPLQAFRIRYFPLRTAAFIDDDSFLWHLARLCRRGPVHALLEFAEPELVADPLAARAKWHSWCRGFGSPLELPEPRAASSVTVFE